MTEGTVLHADLDSFFASVEQRDDPQLRGKPVIVGGGVVLAASYEAKAFGVQGAMGGRQALRLCPDAIIVRPRFDAYVTASREVFKVFHDTTPLVEGMSIDEAFLDVGGLRRLSGEPSVIAARLRDQVRERVGLPISVGVARTKHLAKIASALCKPDGLRVVPIEDELAFLHALPVERLWGVGPATSAKLHAARITTVGQIASFEPAELAHFIGPGAAHHLHALAHNRDPRRVRTATRRRSIGSQHVLGRGAHTDAALDRVLQTLVDRVSRRLRGSGRAGTTVVLRLRFGDFSRSTTSHTTARPTDQQRVRPRPRAPTAGAAASGDPLPRLHAAGHHAQRPRRHGTQLMLPFEPTSSGGGTSRLRGTVDQAVDAVRDKFGTASIGPASVAIGRTGRSAQPVRGLAQVL